MRYNDAVDPGTRSAIAALPDTWHGAGTVTTEALDAIERWAESIGPDVSVETGTGRTTLLLSHISAHHIVFTKDDAGDGDSLDQVRSSSLLHADVVEFVIGPTQRTLPSHELPLLQFAVLDGPHAWPFPEIEYWCVYPRIEVGGVLVVDDVQIPTIGHMAAVLGADAMWDHLETVGHTAFFRRTDAPMIDPYGEGWWLQGFNVVAPTPRRSLPTRAIGRLRRLVIR